MFSSGITHEEMVQESKRHWQRLEQNAQKQQKVRHRHILKLFERVVCPVFQILVQGLIAVLEQLTYLLLSVAVIRSCVAASSYPPPEQQQQHTWRRLWGDGGRRSRRGMHRRRWREPHGWGGCGRCVGKGAPPQPENEVRVRSVLERRTGQRA